MYSESHCVTAPLLSYYYDYDDDDEDDDDDDYFFLFSWPTSTEPVSVNIESKQCSHGCNGISFRRQCVFEGDRIPSLNSHGQALKQELLLLLLLLLLICTDLMVCRTCEMNICCVSDSLVIMATIAIVCGVVIFLIGIICFRR